MILSASMEFFVSNSISQSVEQNGDQCPNDYSLASDIISGKKEFAEQEKSQTENVKKEQLHNFEDNLSETREISSKQEIFQNNEITEQDDEQIVQEIENIQEAFYSVLPEKKEEEPIRENKKTEQSEEKTKNSENYQQSGSKEDDRDIRDIVDEDEPAAKEEIETKSIQENSTLDLTQSDFACEQIIPPKIISVFQPTYPDKLRKRKIEGKVQLKVLISKEGKAMQVEIYASSGYQDFDQAAVQSVFQWKFKPTQFDNKERDSWVLIPIVFKLE